MRMWWLASVVVAALAVSCGSDGAADGEPSSVAPGPLMRPGWNCLASGCHFPDRLARPPDWGAAGTIFARSNDRADQGVAGVNVHLRDADGKEVHLVTNAAGNFFTAEALKGPIEVALEREGRTIKMPKPAPAGSCNFCHSMPTIEDGPKGRIFAP